MLLGAEETPPEGASVWLYEGTLERFSAPGVRFRYRQRIAWPAPPAPEQVQELGRWMVERLSINGHLLIGLRAYPEGERPESAQAIRPGGP
jgi:hypothetical protein